MLITNELLLLEQQAREFWSIHLKIKLFVRDQESKGTNAQAVKTGPAKAGELFNLEDDMAETTDVSADYPEMTAQIKKMADQFLSDFDKNKRKAGRLN